MELYVRHPDHDERVAVDLRGSKYHFVIDERSYVVEAAWIGSSLSLIIDGQQTEASVVAEGVADGAARYWVSTEAGSEPVEVLEPLAYLAARSEASAVRRGAEQVLAIMPGRVVSLLVGPGDPVERGQGVLVIEAMKMENEIKAESGGVVTEIHVAVGAAVETGDRLFDVGPR